MSILDDVQEALGAGRYRITGHGADEMADDGIDEADLLAATNSGEVIEDYPTLNPCPACLVLGYGEPERPIHAVWAYDAATARAILVTTYRPDPDRWSLGYRRRVKS